MSGGQFVWLSGILCDGNLQRNQLKGGEYSDSSDSSDQAVEVFYDHRSGVPQHEQADTSTVRGGDGLAHQPLRPIPGKQQQQQQPPIKQVPSAAVTTPPDEACKGSVDSFPVSTVASATPGATSSALVGVVDEAVVTMNHAVRVPSALRGAGRRTMFDVLVDVAARQRRQEQRQANPQESAEGKNLSRKAGITTGSAQVLAPHPSGTAASTLGGASSAREVTYQVLFPRTAVAAGATGTSSWGLTTSADAVVPPSLSRSKRIPAYASPVTHLSPPPSSSSPPERAKPDRGLRHLLPAHLRGCSATSQSSADHSQGHQLQTVWKHEAKHPHAWYADDRTGVSALDTSNTSSISSCSDGDTGTRDTRRPPPRRGTRRSVTESLTAASASSPQAQSAAAQTTLFSRLINGDAGEFVHPRHHHEGRHQAASERPEGVTKNPTARRTLLEQVLMGTAGAAASTHARRSRHPSNRPCRRHSRRHRVRRNTVTGSSERSTTHSTTTGTSASDLDGAGSGVEDSGHDSGDVVDLRRDLDDEVPQWVRKHEASRKRLAQLQKQQQQQQRFSWASPTFSNAHMTVATRALASGKASAQVVATAAAPQAFLGKPRIFCPSSMAPRTPGAASYTAGGLAGGGAVWSAVSKVGRGRQNTRSALTAAATAGGASRSLLEFWKEGKRMLKQRPSNATAVAVVEYLWQRFQAWKPHGLLLLHQLHSGFGFCNAAAPPLGSSLSRTEQESCLGRLLMNPASVGCVEGADRSIEDISSTSSNDEGGDASAVYRKAARKLRRVTTHASPERLSRGTSNRSIDAAHWASAQSEDQGKAGDAAASTAAAAEADGSSDEGIELQMKVHYMESAFNIVAVHGELTYVSESACARLGLSGTPPPVSPCVSSHVSGRADDAQTTPAAEQKRWTFLVPEPALTQAPVLLQEHLYLAPPYTVFRGIRTILSSYNLTTDTLLRKQAAEEETTQVEVQQRRALDASTVAGKAAAKTSASSTTIAVASRAAADFMLEGHMLDSGYGESDGCQQGVSPTRSGSLRNDTAASAPPHWWATLEGKDERLVCEAASIHERASADCADAPMTNYTSSFLRQELDGAPVYLDPTRLDRATPLKHPQHQQWPVEDEEETHLRAQSAHKTEGHTSTLVRQCGSGRVGTSPEPHQPVSRLPPLEPPPPLHDAGNQCGADNAETQCPQGVLPGHLSVSPSCVRASTASVNSILIDGFYDPLAMPALPTTGVKRGAVAPWGTNERWGDGGGSGTNNLATVTASVTQMLTRESENPAGSEVVPKDALERELTAKTRELPIPPQMAVRPSNKLHSRGEVEISTGVYGGVAGDDARARGSNVRANEMSTVTAAAISADSLMDHRIGGGFPRGPTSDWDIPVEVLFALSGGGSQWREQSVRQTRWCRDAEVDCAKDDNSDGSPMTQQGHAGVCSRVMTSARLAHKRHRCDTRTKDGAVKSTALGKISSALDSATASHIASQKMVSRATLSLPTPHSRSLSASSSLISWAEPSSSNPSSLSEPEDGDDDGVKGGDTPHAVRGPCWKNTKRAVRWPRHGTRRSGHDKVFVAHQHQQQQQQERWIRELWGPGKQKDEPPVLLAAPSTVSAPAHASVSPSQRSQHQQQVAQSHSESTMCTLKRHCSVAGTSISARSAASFCAKAASLTRETDCNSAVNSAQLRLPPPDEDSAAMALRVDALKSLSSLEAITRSVPGVPVLQGSKDEEASTATTGFFALEDVYLSDAD